MQELLTARRAILPPTLGMILRHMTISQSPIASTIAYLRFPLRLEHRGRLRDGIDCPHCHQTRIHKWGQFAGRQRFRCLECRRTFSTFTGTPLHYLKRPERWRAFLWCMEGQLTVRRTGVVVGIDKNTALRWRHRTLDHWRREPRRRLRGSIGVGAVWLPQNEKGSRRLARGARRCGYAPGRNREGVAWITLLAAVETGDRGTADHWIGRADTHILRQGEFAALLDSRLGCVHEIVGGRGVLCPLARYAASLGAGYRPQGGGEAASVKGVRLQLKRWLRPFRGVASHRLDNYLEWFRRAGAGWRTALSPTVHADRDVASRDRGASPPAPRRPRQRISRRPP